MNIKSFNSKELALFFNLSDSQKMNSDGLLRLLLNSNIVYVKESIKNSSGKGRPTNIYSVVEGKEEVLNYMLTELSRK